MQTLNIHNVSISSALRLSNRKHAGSELIAQNLIQEIILKWLQYRHIRYFLRGYISMSKSCAN